MKKTLRSIALAALALAGFSSCDELLKPGEEKAGTMDIKIQTVGSDFVTYQVSTSNESFTYITAVVEKQFVDKVVEDDDVFNLILDRVQQEVGPNTTYEAYLRERIKTGGAVISVDGLAAETDYCVVGAGISTDGERTTAAVMVDFKTEKASGQEDPGNKDPFSFDIKIEQVTDYDVTYSIYPTDNKSTYLIMLVEKEYFDSFGSDEEYFQDDLEYFQSIAEAYEMTLTELLSESLSQGATEQDVMDDLDPETEYYIYCYGLTASGIRTTSIYKAEFKTDALQKSDVQFNTTISVDGATASVKVVPSDGQVLYFADAWSKNDFETSDYAAEIAEYAEDIAALYKAFGLSVEDLCVSGPISGNLYLDPNEDFIFFAVALSQSGKCISDVSLTEFRTGDVKPSENVINLSVKPGSNSATVYASTTNDDPYVIGVLPAEEFLKMSEEQIVDAIIESATGDYGVETLNGSDYIDVNALDPQTNYVAVAFGCHAGIQTTQVFMSRFTTTEKVESTGKLVITPGYYDGDQVYAAMGADYADCKGYAFFFVDVRSEGISSYYWDIFNYSADLMQVSDSEFQAYLLSEGNTNDESAYIIDWNTTLVLVYFGIDEAGNPTDMTREVVNVTKDNAISLYSSSPSNVKKARGFKTPDTKLGQKKAIERKAARAQKTYNPVVKDPRHRNF